LMDDGNVRGSNHSIWEKKHITSVQQRDDGSHKILI